MTIFLYLYIIIIFLKLQQHKQRHKEKLQPASVRNNNCWSVCHTGFHRKQGLEKGALTPHSCSFFTTITHPAIFFIAFPNSWHFVCKNNKINSKNCKGKLMTSFEGRHHLMRTWLIHVCSLYVWFPQFPTNRQENPRLWVVPHFSSGTVGVIFTRACNSLALLSLRKNGGLLIVYENPASHA